MPVRINSVWCCCCRIKLETAARLVAVGNIAVFLLWSIYALALGDQSALVYSLGTCALNIGVASLILVAHKTHRPILYWPYLITWKGLIIAIWIYALAIGVLQLLRETESYNKKAAEVEDGDEGNPIRWEPSLPEYIVFVVLSLLLSVPLAVVWLDQRRMVQEAKRAKFEARMEIAFAEKQKQQKAMAAGGEEPLLLSTDKETAALGNGEGDSRQKEPAEEQV